MKKVSVFYGKEKVFELNNSVFNIFLNNEHYFPLTHRENIKNLTCFDDDTEEGTPPWKVSFSGKKVKDIVVGLSHLNTYINSIFCDSLLQIENQMYKNVLAFETIQDSAQLLIIFVGALKRNCKITFIEIVSGA